MTFDSTELDLTPEREWAMKGGSWGAPSACGCNATLGRTCFYHKLKTIQFAGTKKSPQTRMEAQWERDRPAYARLRSHGLQPPSVKGSAELEKRANSQTEIELGHVFDKKTLPKVEEGMAIAREMTWKPQDSVDALKDKTVRS